MEERSPLALLNASFYFKYSVYGISAKRMEINGKGQSSSNLIIRLSHNSVIVQAI